MYRIIHNGYTIEYCKTEAEVNDYMKGIVSKYSHLSPKKIFDRTFKSGDNTDSQSTRIVRYRYYTLYEEVFVIELMR
ncbi:MAG: hypothetical protein J6A59_13100 [Lachnospiraceae bacterium]|nr:hypothetical protein [Lachnospiraceae bacterium]